MASSGSDGTRVLRIEPLTREAFAPYGDLIDAGGVEPVAINDGTALKFPELAPIELVGGGQAAISIYRAQPRSLPMPLLELERHPLGSQAFIPLQPTRYLVVVGGSAAEPKPEDVRVFLATGQRGVNLHAGVWHHALLALEPCELVVVDRGARDRMANLDELDCSAWKLSIGL